MTNSRRYVDGRTDQKVESPNFDDRGGEIPPSLSEGVSLSSKALRGRAAAIKLMLVVAIVLALQLALPPARAAVPDELSATPDDIWDVTSPDPEVRHTGQLRALVWDMQEYQGRMYVAGKFLELRAPDGALHQQPYLAAFDLETGDWIESFQPEIDGAIYSMTITDDGRLIAAGELSGGMIAIDPATGETDSSFAPDINLSWGPRAVFDVEAVGDSIYAGGRFSEADGTTLANLGRFDATTGRLDPSWLPTTQFDDVTARNGGQLVYGLAIDSDRDRVYTVGKFGYVNNDRTAAYFAILDTENGELRNDVNQGLPPQIMNHSDGISMWQHDVQFRDDKVYLGGQAHQTLILNANDLSPTNSYFTNFGMNGEFGGGDTQVIFLGQETIWSGCHCWGSVGNYELGSYISSPDGVQTLDEYRQWRNDFETLNSQQNVRGGYAVDMTTREIEAFTPSLVGQGGAWAIVEDSNDRVWFGGHFFRDPETSKQFEGLARFSAQG